MHTLLTPHDPMLRTHLDLEPEAGLARTGQKAPVLRNSAVCVYYPDLIYVAQRATEPAARHRRPSTVNLNQAGTGETLLFQKVGIQDGRADKRSVSLSNTDDVQTSVVTLK